MADLATLLASTGMRTGEVLGLQWADVDLVAGEFTWPRPSPTEDPG